MRYEPKALHRLLRTRQWRSDRPANKRGGGGGHPDPEIKGGGGRVVPRFPSLDPPLQENEKRT